MNRLRTLVAVAVLATSSAVVAATSAPVSAVSCTISVTLRQGSSGSAVTCLESRLKELGYSLSGPDTYFGTTTTSAVKAFQKSKGLLVDGIVGPVTGMALGIRGGSSGGGATVPPKILEQHVIGVSAQGRGIVAYRLGTPGGRVVLAIGQTHGDEPKGPLVTQAMRTMPIPAGIDLWIIDTMNPDGSAAATRQNANRVDLNRNFTYNWNYIPLSANNGQYSGERPGDQPETVAMQNLIQLLKPQITVWYHQDANRVGASGARKEIPIEYARRVNLTTASTPCTAGCTGTAGSFTNKYVPGGTSFLVEMPNSRVVTQDMINLHAKSFLAVITM
jgi:protein MpaA